MKSSMGSSAMLLALLSMVSAQCITAEAPDAAEGPFYASISAVESNLSLLNSLVQSWSKDAGLAGALAIQQNYYPLYSAVTSLNAAAGSLTPIDPKNVVNYSNSMTTLVADISSLIGSLNEKANDLASVGAASIVSGDILSLAGPASEIEANLFSNLPSSIPCDQQASAAAFASSLNAAFQGAGTTYSIAGLPQFPTAPAACSSYCGGATSPSSTSSSSSTSSATTAAATSSAEAAATASTSTPVAAASSSAAATTPPPAVTSAEEAVPSAAVTSADPSAAATEATTSAVAEGPCVTSAAANPVQAAFGSSVNAVIAPLTSLNALVEQWSVADGLQGALSIQQGYQPLYDAVMGLKQAVGSIPAFVPNDVVSYVQTLNTLVGDISTLLGSLNAKAQDFAQVGAAQIVHGDVSSLAGPASEIAASIFGNVPTDAPCPVIASASVVGSSLGAAFSGAGVTFSIADIPQFPAAPTACLSYCGGQTGVPTGTASPGGPAGNVTTGPSHIVGNATTSSPAHVGNATTSAPAEKPATSGGAAGGAQGTLTTVVTAFTTYCPEPTTLCPGNGKCYTVTEATTLTVTDCPCTIPKEEATTYYKVTAATTLTRTAAPKTTVAPVATVPAAGGTAVVPANGASNIASGLYAALVGVVAFALL